MAEKFKHTYRIPSTRLQHWDYASNAAYFVTLCTKNRNCCFGTIANGKMNLSNIGVIADVMWFEIKNHTNSIELGAFVVMPNHIHGIVTICGNGDDAVASIGQKRFQHQGKNSLSSIIGSYKSAVSKHAHRLGYEFQWQTRFYEHIIRDAGSYQRITEYIDNNPLKWDCDKFFLGKW